MQGMYRLSNVKCSCLKNELVIYLIELLAELNELTFTKCSVCFPCGSDGKDLPAVQETQV